MSLKLPPVLIFLLFSIVMFLLARFLPFGDFQFFGRNNLVLFLMGMAVLIAIISLSQFFSRKTTIDPRTPFKTTKLVTRGIYKYSRNPMYLAILLVLLAWGLWLGNAFNTLVAAGFVGYMNKFQIKPEEQALTTIFGKEYEQYCTQVRRWF
ncbi:MAG: isoprenylcysteine carboxylmethyltransferase family protein [Maribacter sp.]|nr:isoprenylcysteine carboxylmethyltransferase family protein [Maribacter sp.]